jgi:hypothetical protein
MPEAVVAGALATGRIPPGEMLRFPLRGWRWYASAL